MEQDSQVVFVYEDEKPIERQQTDGTTYLVGLNEEIREEEWIVHVWDDLLM